MFSSQRKQGKDDAYDSFTLYDGNSNTAPLIGEYCGQSLPPTFISSTNEAFLHFQSDESGTKSGFKLEYHPHSKLCFNPKATVAPDLKTNCILKAY